MSINPLVLPEYPPGSHARPIKGTGRKLRHGADDLKNSGSLVGSYHATDTMSNMLFAEDRLRMDQSVDLSSLSAKHIKFF